MAKWLGFAYWAMLPVALGAACFALSNWLGDRWTWLNGFEAGQTTARIQELATEKPDTVNSDIVIVLWDKKSESALDRMNSPPTRDQIAKLLKKLYVVGAKRVVLDFVLESPNPSVSQSLIQSLIALPKNWVVLANAVNENGETQLVSLDHLVPSGTKPNFAVGHNIFNDFEGQIVGQEVLIPGTKKQAPLPSIGLMVYLLEAQLTVESAVLDSSKNELRIGRKKWSLNKNNWLLIPWPNPSRIFSEVSFLDVLNMPTEELSTRLKGKIVFIGDGTKDFVTTASGAIPGVCALAHTYNLLVQRQRIIPEGVKPYVHWTWGIFIAAIAAALGLQPRWIPGILGIFGVALLSVFVPQLVVSISSQILESATVLFAALIAFLSGTFASRAIPTPGRLSGTRFHAAVLFFDLKGSTELMQSLGPRAYGSLFRTIIQELETTAQRLGGEIERTTGDGALVVFEDTRSGHRIQQAILAAKALQNHIGKINRERGFSVTFFAGLEHGEITGDYVWEGGHRSWSSAGVPVNLAARLMDFAAKINQPMLIGPNAARAISEELIELTPAVLQGFEKEVRIFIWNQHENKVERSSQ